MLKKGIKNEFIKSKKYLPFVLIMSLVLPIFIISQLKETMGSVSSSLGFIVSVVFI